MDASAAYEAHGSAVFQLGELENEIDATTQDLTVTEGDLGEAQARLEDRASRMYKSGNVGFVDVLVGAENFNDFSNRLELWVRLLSQERAEFDRVSEIRDTLAEKKALLEATRDRRVDAIDEADSQLDQASGLETDAQAYLDSLNEELRAAMEAEQARQAEQARAAGQQLRAELAAAEPEAVPVADVPEEIPAPTLTLAATSEEAPAATQAPVPSPEEAQAPTRALDVATEDVAPEKTVKAEPVAATVPEPVETPEVDLAAQQNAEKQAARAAKQAAEQRATEQAAAELYAAEKAAAAEEARLLADQAAAAEQQQYAAEASKAERRAELAAERAAAEQQAADQAAAQQAEAELLAAEQQAATDQQAAEQQAADEQYAAGQEAAAQQQYETEQAAGQAQPGTDGTMAEAPADEQYGDPGSTAPAAAPAAAQPAAAAPAAPVASGSGSGVVAEAAKYMGAPYVLGGPSICVPYESMDCSCLTMTAFQAFGISLPDDPVAQFGMGVPVSGPPQAGDLVFWAEGGAGITHVGIATGNGTTVHASAYEGYVTETPIDAIPGYVGARRVL